MRRREVIALLSAVLARVATTPVPPSKGSRAPRVARIGVLNYAAEQLFARRRISDGSCVLSATSRGRTSSVVHRWADGRSERLPELAAELINGGVDVMIALGPAAWAR